MYFRIAVVSLGSSHVENHRSRGQSPSANFQRSVAEDLRELQAAAPFLDTGYRPGPAAQAESARAAERGSDEGRVDQRDAALFRILQAPQPHSGATDF